MSNDETFVLSQEQEQAVERILSSEKQVRVLTGQAGSGKSTITRQLVEAHGYGVCATTGRAAMNVQGPTVDSLFAFNRNGWEIWSNDYLERMMLATPDNIIIDEASMIGQKMGDLLHDVISHRPFNKRLVLVGDWAQASPVKDGLCLDSQLFGDYEFIKLWENHRQSEQQLAEALNDLRVGQVSPETGRLIRSRLCPVPPDDDRYIRMYATNRKTEVYNNARLFRHVAESQSPLFRVYTQFEDTRSEHQQKKHPRGQAFRERAIEASPLGHGESLAPGCRVLLTVNQGMFVNGDTGTIIDAHDFSGRNVQACVEDYERDGRNFQLQSIRVRLDRTGREVAVAQVRREVRDPTGRFIQHTLTGFPIRKGYACTIHKAQGMTVDRAWVDIESLKNFPDDESRHGLAYVALSRTRTLEGLLIGSWDPQMVYCNPAIKELL